MTETITLPRDITEHIEMVEAICKEARCCGGIAFDIWEAIVAAAPADNGWIKCSDRLPEEGQSVLVAIPVGNSFNVENATYRNDGVFLCCWCTKRGKNCAYDVTYWRPLPPLPTAPLDH